MDLEKDFKGFLKHTLEISEAFGKTNTGPVRNLASQNITFLLCDDQLASEELLIGLPVLHHLKVDNHTILEFNFANLIKTDRLQDKLIEKEKIGKIGRLIAFRLSRSRNPTN